MKLDLFKIGIFLLGIGAIIFSIGFLYLLFKTTNQNYDKFWAYCENNYLIIHARENLQNVSIIDIDQNKVLCKFDHIPQGSEEVCKVNIVTNQTRLLKVVSQGYSKVVRCYKYEIRFLD